MNNNNSNNYDSMFRPSFQDPKKVYLPQSQPLLSSQQIPSQQFSYPGNNPQSSNLLNQQNIQPPNPYMYNNGSQPIPSQSMTYPAFNNGRYFENDKLNQKNNFQLRKLKKARLKRQKKAEYIDFLEQRISQLDRIIKQNNLTFVEPPQDSEKPETSNTEPLTPPPVSSPYSGSNSISNNRTNDVNNLKRKSLHEDPLNQQRNVKKNTYEFENCRYESFILLQRHTLDVDITLNLTNEYFEEADEFFNIPDEIISDFYELDKQTIDLKNDSLNIFKLLNGNIPANKNLNSNNDILYDKEDPYGIFSSSFCTSHIQYKRLSDSETFNDFVVIVIQSLFVNCSYFPPDDLIDLQTLRKDLYTHNLFLVNSLCAYGLALLPFDIPYNICDRVTFLNNCIESCPAESLEDFYIKYIKNKEITYKQIFAMADMFNKEALKYHFFDGPIELHTIEGYISLCLYNYLIGNFYKAYEYLGIAIRYGDAFDLNSYIDNDDFGVEKIISKRLWWKCYAYDTMSVKMIDTDGFFNDTRFDKFTRNKIDYYNHPEENFKPEEVKKMEKNSTFLILHRLVRVWKRTNAYFSDKLKKRLNKNYFNSLNKAKPGYSLFKKAPLKEDENNNEDEFVLDPQKESIKMEIKNIWDLIPEIFKRVSIVNSSMNPNILKLMASYNFLYYAAIIHLYRPQKVLKNFTWSNSLSKNSYNRIVSLRCVQRISRFLYYFYKMGIMDLIPNALLFPIYDTAAIVLSDFRAEENLSKKRPIEFNEAYYEEKKNRLTILNTLIIFFYHKAKHQLIANIMLKSILDFTSKNNIPTIIQPLN